MNPFKLQKDMSTFENTSDQVGYLAISQDIGKILILNSYTQGNLLVPKNRIIALQENQTLDV